MSEIIFTQTFEKRDHIKDIRSRDATDRKVTIFRSPGKVAIVQSTLVCGVPRGHRDKRYYYWRSIGSYGFRRNRAGTVVPFSCKRPWNAKSGVGWTHSLPDEPFNWLEYSQNGNDDAGEVFRHAVWAEFGVRKIQDMYPMLDKYRLNSYRTIPNTLKMPFRVDDWSEFTERVFGKTRTTPRLTSAVKKSEPYFVAYAQQFRGLVPDNDIIDFLDRNSFDDEMEEGFTPHSPSVRPFLLKVDDKTRKSLISMTFDLSDMNRVYRFVMFGKRYMEQYATAQPYVNWSQVSGGSW